MTTPIVKTRTETRTTFDVEFKAHVGSALIKNITYALEATGRFVDVCGYRQCDGICATYICKPQRIGEISYSRNVFVKILKANGVFVEVE